MSGGSWDYLCFKIDEAADRLMHESSPLRRAFGQHLSLCAKAMHDIEWVDSGDKGEGDEVEAIRAVLEDTVAEKTLAVVRRDVEELLAMIDSASEGESNATRS